MADIDFDDWTDARAPARASSRGAARQMPAAAPQPAPRGGRLAMLGGLAGAGLSVALVAGLGVWAYRLAVRDTYGVPVVRALEGPARVAPADPGGESAAYQGLAVNTIAAEGEAAPPPDQLVLAPRPVDLAEDDATAAALSAPPAAAETARPAVMQGDGVRTVAPEPGSPAADLLGEPMATDNVAAMVSETTAATPLDTDASPAASPAVPDDAPGVARSIRPRPRPAAPGLAVAAAPATDAGAADMSASDAASDAAVEAAVASALASMAPAAPVAEVEATTLPAGTRLVQLGAYDDAQTARAEWDRLAALDTLAPLIAGKSRVIEQAETGGQVFYRLRAMGFADVDEARRFCAAFAAENAGCVPVQSR